jgi:hypothetical protein
MIQNTQVAPYPNELAALVTQCVYRDGWTLTLLQDHVRDPASTHTGESRGLTLSVVVSTTNSYPPHQPIRVQHLFAVPPATYNKASWQRWLFEQLLLVERHEACEFFTIDDVKPFAPNHGPGEDPYRVTELTTDEARRTSFRGEVNA